MAIFIRKCMALLLAAAMLLGLFGFVSAAEEREVVPLKDVYAGRFMIGTVMNPRDSGSKLELIRTHFNALTPENNTKPDNIWNSPSGSPNFSQTDTMVSARKADGFYTIGHALAWHNQSSNWPSPDLTYEQAREQLELYISTVAGHFYENESIRFDAWDVVNEAMRDNPENPTDWRNALRHGDLPIERPAKWYAAYANGGNGWDYVYDAFLFARKYAPNATLNYNDFNDEELPSKAIAIASMVTELNERYAAEHPEDPRKLIESIGIQGHYSLRLNLDNLEQVLKIYAATGCRICVTELDVQYNGSVGRTLTEEQQREQAIFYARLFMLYKKYDKFIDRVTFWGTDDSSNWRSSQRPMIFDVNRNPKEAYWAVVDPEGYLGLGKEAPRLSAISYGGQELDCSLYDVDINVPKDVDEVTLTAENVVHEYDPSQVRVTVQMDDNKVPCTAVVRIAWTDAPESFNEYTVNFGHMSAEWLNDVNYPDTGYRSTVRVRFSDGESKLKLQQSFTEEGGALNTLAEIDPPAKNGAGLYHVATQAQLDKDYLARVTLKKTLYDPEGNPVMPGRFSDFSKPERFYRLADSIEPGKTYIIVSSATGKAFTHKALQPVPAGGGLTESKAGYEATQVTVRGDTIVAPELIQDNIRFIFLPRESPDAGPYSDGFNLLSLVHGGLIQPFIIWREDVSTPTAGLYSNATIGDADLDRAVWYNTGFDPVTHETTLFLHSASKGLTYVLTGNDQGFAAQGGSGSIDEYKSLGRVKLYEYVEEPTEVYEIRFDVQEGTVSTGAQYAKPGETVTLNVTASEDAPLEELKIIASDGSDVEVTEKGGGDYTFVMPSAHVQITIRFQEKRYYTVKFIDADAGEMTEAARQAMEGETVYFGLKPNGEYDISSYSVRASGGDQINVKKETDDILSFVMPADDVLITFKFVMKTYDITVARAENGTLGADAPAASAGSVITVTAKPNEGYQLKELSVKTSGGDTVETDAKGEDRYQFVMPSGGVVISAVFELPQRKNPFVDVKEGDYFYDPVLWAVEKGITKGTSETRFSPDSPCTRGQMATFLWRAMGSPEPSAKSCAFSDVKEGDYFYKAVLWALENGITKGTSDTTFSPNSNCTRGQMATFLYRLDGEKGADAGKMKFTDVKKSDYFYNAVAWAVQAGITKGTSDTTFSPASNCTRGQMVTFLYRYLGDN